LQFFCRFRKPLGMVHCFHVSIDLLRVRRRLRFRRVILTCGAIPTSPEAKLSVVHGIGPTRWLRSGNTNVFSRRPATEVPIRPCGNAHFHCALQYFSNEVFFPEDQMRTTLPTDTAAALHLFLTVSHRRSIGSLSLHTPCANSPPPPSPPATTISLSLLEVWVVRTMPVATSTTRFMSPPFPSSFIIC
jgi:hypothetical protein